MFSMRKRGKTESHLLTFQTDSLQRLQKLGEKGSKILICLRIRHHTSSLLRHWPLEENLSCLLQLYPWAAQNTTLPEPENEFKIPVYGNHLKGRGSGSYSCLELFLYFLCISLHLFIGRLTISRFTSWITYRVWFAQLHVWIWLNFRPLSSVSDSKNSFLDRHNSPGFHLCFENIHVYL